jgi:hypothetical protein
MFVFVQIPKTGGTSIADLLSINPMPRGWDNVTKKYRQHFTISELIENTCLTTEQSDFYFKFAFVRNPWDRLLSEYIYRKRVHTGGLFSRISLKEMLTTKWTTRQRHMSIKQHIRPQCEYVYDNDVQCVDFVGRFENLQEDFNIVCDKIGIPHQELPHKNTTDHKHYTEYYDEETRELVAEKYKKDIEYFGYEFGGS